MSVFSQYVSAIAGAVKSVLHHEKVNPAAQAAGRIIRDGIDVFEATTLNKSHKHIASSKPQHLKAIFSIAAGCAVVGIAAPVMGTGLAVSAVSIVGLEVAKLMAYRGLRVLMPYDSERISHPQPVRSLKDMVHNTLDFFEAVSLNKQHPWLGASDKKALGSMFLTSALGIGAGVALMVGTVGLPALAGVAITETGKMGVYRGYRIMFPYESRLDPPVV